MGRLVYVREVCKIHPPVAIIIINTDVHLQDREAEPRFIGGPQRGDFGGGGRGGFGGGYGGGPGGGAPGRQLYVSNVCSPQSPNLLIVFRQALLTSQFSCLSTWVGRT